MIEKKIEKQELDVVIAFLQQLDLFKHLGYSPLKELAQSMTMIFCEGGEVVIHQQDANFDMYLVYLGMCRVYQTIKNKQVFVGEISKGQFVGEMSLLANQPRTTTVVASRDSIFLKINKDAYIRFEKNHPSIALDISKQTIKRLILETHAETPPTKGLSTIAVSPAGDSDHRPFIRSLQETLNTLKPTIIVTKELCNSHFGIDVAQEEQQYHSQISDWLQGLENTYGYLIFETDRQMTPWTKRCLRQADRILMIAEENVHPTLNSIEMTVFSKEWKYHPDIDLLFLHPTTRIVGTAPWLKNRPIQGFHHIMIDSEKDKAKLIRFLTGQAIGVVLTGGGARGFAHMGFIKAMDESGIPIDYIAGSSMGALVAAPLALGMRVDEMIKFAHDFSYRSQYTLPLVALTTGKFLTDMLHSLCHDTMIEDLPIRYFCVSTNVTEGKLKIHDHGLMWRAIRASLSVPGIFPPIYDNAGNMLVDGGILNNMPVDIMRKMMYKGKVICVRCFAKEERLEKKFINDTWVSGWKLFLKKIFPFYRKAEDYDKIGNIILESLNVGSKSFEKSVESLADCVIEFDTSAFTFLQFDKMDDIIDLGYRVSMEKLQKFPPENGN